MSHLKTIFSERIAAVRELVARTNKSSVLIVQQFPTERDTLTQYPKVRESISNILAFVELGELPVLQEIIAMADGVFDHIALDADIKLPASKALLQYAQQSIKKSKLFFYSDINTWADSALQFILQKEGGLCDKKVMLTGQGMLHDALAHRLAYFGIERVLTPDERIDVLIGAALKAPSVDVSMLERFNAHTQLYDIGIGNFSASLVEMAIAKGHAVYRIDIRAGISSLVIKVLETDHLIHQVMGKANIKNIELVAGGVMGRKGAIILDDINAPMSVIGVADGQGNVKVDVEAEDHPKLAFALRLIEKAGVTQ